MLVIFDVEALKSKGMENCIFFYNARYFLCGRSEGARGWKTARWMALRALQMTLVCWAAIWTNHQKNIIDIYVDRCDGSASLVVGHSPLGCVLMLHANLDMCSTCVCVKERPHTTFPLHASHCCTIYCVLYTVYCTFTIPVPAGSGILAFILVLLLQGW